MDKRSEPRFQIRSAIKIAAIDHPEQVCEALLLDVSGAGLKIVADNWWPVNTCIVVELENHLVVARVRNIVARGPKFSLGAEKLYSVLKHTMPTGVSRTIWHNLLRAEMRDLPATPERAATESIEPLEIGPAEIAGPVVASSAIAEPEGIARKITLRAPERPETVVSLPQDPREEAPAASAEPPAASFVSTPPKIEVAEPVITPAPMAASASGLLPPAVSVEAPSVHAASVVESQPELHTEHAASTQALVPETRPELRSVAQDNIAQDNVAQGIAEQDIVAQGNAVQDVPVQDVAVQGNDTQGSAAEPKIAGAIAETRPLDDPPSAPYHKPTLLEVLPAEPLPQSLPALREPIVRIPVSSAEPEMVEESQTSQASVGEAAAAHKWAETQQQEGKLPEQISQPGSMHEEGAALDVSQVTPPPVPTDENQRFRGASNDTTTRRSPVFRAVASQIPALQQNPVSTRTNNASIPTPQAPGPAATKSTAKPNVGSQEAADPPFGRPFPLLPDATAIKGVVATPPLAPEFGPAYGMAPTAEGLHPISVMPELQAPVVPEKPRWIVPSAALAAILGIVALGLYYGPFRPKGSSAPRTQSAKSATAPLTIPPVIEKPVVASHPASNPVSNPVSVSPASPVASQPPAGAPITAQGSSAATPATPAVAGAAPVAQTVNATTSPTPATKTAPPALVAKATPPVTPVPVPQAAPAPAPAPAPAKVSRPQASAAASSANAPVGSAGGRRVTVTAASLLWFSACADGKPPFAKVMHTGDTMDIDFRQLVVFKLGNSAAAQMTLDGKALGALGPPGAVKIVELSANGVRELSPKTPAGAECQPMSASTKP